MTIFLFYILNQYVIISILKVLNGSQYEATVEICVFLQLPDGVNVSKEARRAISQAASVFVLYATSWWASTVCLMEKKCLVFLRISFLCHSANNFAMKAKRKTLNAGDVLAAMEEMEFERFLEPLKEALEGLFISANHVWWKYGTFECVCVWFIPFLNYIHYVIQLI